MKDTAAKDGAAFLREISRYCRERGLREKSHPAKAAAATTPPAPRLAPKSLLIAQAFNAGASLSELMRQFEIGPRTVLEHLYKCARHGRALRAEGFAQISSLASEERERVLAVFEEKGADFLKPVFEALDGKVDYDELFVLRLYYLCLENRRKSPAAEGMT